VPDSKFVTRFDQLVQRRWHYHARDLALTGLSWGSGSVRAPELRRPRVQFLYLHHVLDDEVESFRQLLRLLVRDHTLIPYSEAVDRVLHGPIDKPYISFSFDDGLRSCLAAAEVLEEFGASACFFICPPAVGLKSYPEVSHFCTERLGVRPMELLDWPDVDRLLHAGHEIGAHTLGHFRVADLDDADAEHEVFGSREQLQQRVGPVAHFAWPFGRFEDFSAAGERAVRAAGFRSLASAERGCHVVPAYGQGDRLCIRRDQVIARSRPEHTAWFCIRSARRASAADNLSPAEWDGQRPALKE
jgi:peptidoglycan/xylan/chitin deacetylase (PgdA/CDA1 family)